MSAPSSVVRSTIRTAISSAQSLASRLIDRVARAAARACAPVWSTPGSPCSARRSAASESTAPLPGAGGTGTPARAVSVTGAGRRDRGAGHDVGGRAGVPVIGGHTGYLPSPGIRTTESLAARAVAKPGLMTVLMIRIRSSKWPKALFIALIVSHSMSDQP